MGWASATGLFDGAVDAAVRLAGGSNPPPPVIAAAVEMMYEVFDGSDWDTEDESKYYEPYLKNVLLRKGYIDEE